MQVGWDKGWFEGAMKYNHILRSAKILEAWDEFLQKAESAGFELNDESVTGHHWIKQGDMHKPHSFTISCTLFAYEKKP